MITRMEGDTDRSFYLSEQLEKIRLLCEKIHQRKNFPAADEYGDGDYEYACGKIQGQKELAEEITRVLRN